MAEKKKAPTKKKITTVRKSVKKAPAKKNAVKVQPERSSHVPLYLLCIMALLTLLFLLGKNYLGNISKTAKPAVIQRVEDKVSGKAKTAVNTEPVKIPDEKKTPDNIKNTSNVNDNKNIEPQKQLKSEKVKIYLISFNDSTEKSILQPVWREVKGEVPLQLAIEALIKGPNNTEEKKGLLTAVPTNLRLNSATIKDGNAVLDFNGVIENNAVGSILINRLDQIVYTATQFPGVKGVIIKINGQTRKSLGVDGLSLSGPLHRR